MSILRFEPILRNGECCGPDFIETQDGFWVSYDDHAAAIADKDEEIARLKSKIEEMDQVQGLVCQDCGWAMKFPHEPCRNCECERLRKVVEAATVVADDCDLDLFEERGVCRVKSYKLKALVDALAELEGT